MPRHANYTPSSQYCRAWLWTMIKAYKNNGLVRWSCIDMIRYIIQKETNYEVPS